MGVSWLSREAASETVKDDASAVEPSAAFVHAMQALESRIQGHLVWPWDASFGNASHVWNQCFVEQPPAVVLEVATEADVQIAVPFLAAIQRNFSVPFRIRSGGHSYAGWSAVPHGVILSLSSLNHLNFQPLDDGTAIVMFPPDPVQQNAKSAISLEFRKNWRHGW